MTLHHDRPATGRPTTAGKVHLDPPIVDNAPPCRRRRRHVVAAPPTHRPQGRLNRPGRVRQRHLRLLTRVPVTPPRTVSGNVAVGHRRLDVLTYRP